MKQKCFESGLKFKFLLRNRTFSKKDIVREIFTCPYFLYNCIVAINVVIMGKHNHPWNMKILTFCCLVVSKNQYNQSF